jgi:hypothetical protein
LCHLGCYALSCLAHDLRQNTTIIITEHGICPTLLLGSLPVSVSNEKDAK